MKKSTRSHTIDGKTYNTETTRYESGASKSVTRTGGNVLWPGKITRISTTDKHGNRRTRTY